MTYRIRPPFTGLGKGPGLPKDLKTYPHTAEEILEALRPPTKEELKRWAVPVKESTLRKLVD